MTMKINSAYGDFSVLMSVYISSNPEYLDKAIESVWDKQRLKPRQICLVADGPVTKSVSLIIQKWENKLGEVLKFIQLKTNKGLAVALNVGMSFCSYPLIARMDDDDVSMPERFLLQFLYMTEHPEIDVVGTQVQEYDDELRERLADRILPTDHEDLKKFAKVRSPVNHPSVMFRKASVEKNGKYPIMYPEDYPLWGKMMLAGCKFANLPNVLVLMRSDSQYRNRRGLNFLVGEIKAIIYLYSIGFLALSECIYSLSLRVVYRLLPVNIKLFIKRKFSVQQGCKKR